ncbi:uncharacterized protein LOC120481063 isoform X2 [Pimephales promelas]|uniref:uncharacterized protein LOC120481063 isoform X2 n=1 Tax=Pimephales promelas TaxID=90988 RepID=UPI00195553CD|nr:uncharacterized protein LOC120481063 isoform X2 [Pimephales promelas]
MSKMGLVSIHSFLVKRMTAVAEEIFDAVKENMIEYEQEIERLKQENCCLRSTLTHSRNGVCAETRHHDTQRDGCLQVPLGSELSEIQVKMEVATVMPHDPLRQASTNTSPLSEDFKWQEPSHCLTLLPKMLSKNEDIGGTDTQSSIAFGTDTQSSITKGDQKIGPKNHWTHRSPMLK